MQRARLGFLAVLILTGALAACSSGGGSDTSASTRTTARRNPTTSTGASPSTTAAAPSGGAQWTTYDRDAARTGVAPDGPPSAASVRRLWASATLDGDVYAQPLLVGDRVIVATENDTVYSLNASDGSVVWSTHLGQPVPATSLPCGDVDPVGITSTPVVDTAAGPRVRGRHDPARPAHALGPRPRDRATRRVDARRRARCGTRRAQPAQRR